MKKPKELSQELLPEKPTPKERAEFVLTRLGLDWDDFRGKEVIDLGAGQGELAVAAKDLGIKIMSVERSPELWQNEGGIPSNIPYTIAAAEKMPFPDASYDLVVSFAAPPLISPTKDEIRAVITEVKRILRPGGEFRFAGDNLNASIFEEDELFAAQERVELTADERVKRVRQKSLEFLKSIDEKITEIPITPFEEVDSDDHAYQLIVSKPA